MMKQRASLSRPNIFQYHDYCLFLTDWLFFLKSEDKNQSLRKMAKAAGISPAYLSLVLAKKRSMSERLAGDLSEVLRLEASEKNYFKLLVGLADSGSQAERVKAFEKIRRFAKYQDINDGQIEAFKYMSEWYYVAIRELSAHPSFEADVKWIQGQLIKYVPGNKIEEALEFLLRRNFIKKLPDGKYTLPERDLRCDGGVFQISLNKFHHQILQMSEELMDRLPKEERAFTGYTFMMSPDSYDEVQVLVEELRKKVSDIENRDRKSSGEKAVYHLEMVTIPLTGSRKKSKK